MTTYRLMDGVSGRPGVGSSGTQPPGSATSYTGAYMAGITFKTTGTTWFQGYWWWVPTGGDTGAIKCALWQLTSTGGSGQGMVVPGSVVTSGTLTAGQFNFVAVATPFLLTNDGTPYIAAIGYTATVGFPDTTNQFGSGNPYASGITNGPLVAFASAVEGPQQPFTTASADPSSVMPFNNNANDLLWVDVQITSTVPASPAYRLWPSLPWAKGDGAGGGVSVDTTGYTMSTEFSLSSASVLSKIWFYSGTTAFGATAAAALPTRCAIWDVAGTAVVSGTDNASPAWKLPGGSTASAGGGWMYCDYSGSGVTLSASHNYKVAVFSAGGATWRTVSNPYWASTGLGTSGVTVGPITAPNAAGATPGQDSWNSPSWGYPNTYSNPENDWVDVEVTPPVTPPQLAYSMRMMP